MRYQGGKSRIASEIAKVIRNRFPDAKEIWEPFCGGGAVTRALVSEGFHVHASDNHVDLILMWQALMTEETEAFSEVSEEEYILLRRSKPSARRGFVGFGASFGGSWFGGYGRSPKLNQKIWQFSQRVMFKTRQEIHEKAVFTLADYTATPDDVLVYADPPYVGTKVYRETPIFDHNAFWDWVQKRSGPTFISELTGPIVDGISVIWQKQYKSRNGSNSPSSLGNAQVERMERLFYKALKENQ